MQQFNDSKNTEKEQRKINFNSQVEQCQLKDKQENNKIQKTQIGRKTTVWILQVTNWGDCTGKFQDMAEKRKLQKIS